MANVFNILDIPATGGGLDNDVVELIEVAGGQVLGAGINQVTFDTTRTNTDAAVFSVASSEVEVLVAGTYCVKCSIAGDTNGNSVLHQIIIQNDVGAGFVAVPGTSREVGNSVNTLTGSGMAFAELVLDANDKIRMVLSRLSGSGNVTVDPDGANFSVTRLLS